MEITAHDYLEELITLLRKGRLGRIRVNAALEVLTHRVCCIIAKWKHLHQDYSTLFAGRVNPKKDVVDTSPRQRTAGTATFDGLGVDSKSKTNFSSKSGMRMGSFAN